MQSTDITGAVCLATEPHDPHRIVGSFRGHCPGTKPKPELAGERETVWCEAHGGLTNPHFEVDNCVCPHHTDQQTRARMNATG